MASAHLLVVVEGGADAKRAFATIAADAKRASDVMGSSSRESAKRARKSYEEIVGAALMASAKRQDIEKKLADARERIDRQATNATVHLIGLGVTTEENAAREKERIYKNLAGAFIREEQRKTKAAEQENKKRVAFFRQAGREMGRSVVSGAIGIASAASGQIQDVRARTASNESMINNALYQAGGGGNAAENTQERDRVIGFARAHRIDAASLAGGLKGAQEQFSVLGDSHTSHADRMAAIDRQMQIGLFAANTRQDPAEIMRLAGMMQHAGITGGVQTQGLMALTGLAQHGAIEAGSVTKEALGPLMANMAAASSRARLANPNMTEAERGRVNMQSMVDTFAVMESAKGMGKTPRWTGNVMEKLTTNLGSQGFQQKMLANLQNAHQTEAIGTLFDHGRLKSQYTTSLGLSGGLQTAFHGNTEAMQNVFAGTGQGNPQSLARNERMLMTAMMNGGPEIERLRRGVGDDFGQADVDRGEKLRLGEQSTALVRDQQEHDKALGDNTSAINQFSNSLTSWVAQNPITSLIAGQLAPTLLGRIGSFLGGEGAKTAAKGALGLVTRGAPALLASAGLATAAGITTAAGVGLGVGDIANRTLTSQKGIAPTSATPSIFNVATLKEAWRDVFSSTPIRVTMDSHTLAHAQASAATGANPPPPEHRR